MEVERRADIDDGTMPGVTGQESAELRRSRRRIKLLEQENEVLRRVAVYLSQAHLPGTGRESLALLRPASG
ncbi:hypothetical protein ACFYZI_33045 [Streptomyces griseorubiginosus]|uniref:hypothetical protein n=1 Tax=Streptomyces griseorubiginosus TaxID=67304 RepID=UPI0013C46268|nr:hypothetical protein [Streptomyces griseorubiginosus]